MSDGSADRISVVDRGTPNPRRARIVAIQTVLGWNTLPVAALTVSVWQTLSQPASGEDWSAVVAVILVVYVGGAIVLATGTGVAVAAIVMTRRLRAGHVSTAGMGFGWGSLSALLGWLVAVAVVALLLMANTVGIRAVV